MKMAWTIQSPVKTGQVPWDQNISNITRAGQNKEGQNNVLDVKE